MGGELAARRELGTQALPILIHSMLPQPRITRVPLAQHQMSGQVLVWLQAWRLDHRSSPSLPRGQLLTHKHSNRQVTTCLTCTPSWAPASTLRTAQCPCMRQWTAPCKHRGHGPLGACLGVAGAGRSQQPR